MDHLCIRSIGYQKTNFGSEFNAFQVEFGSIGGILRLGQISTQQLLFFLCPSMQRQVFHKPVSNRKKLHRLKRPSNTQANPVKQKIWTNLEISQTYTNFVPINLLDFFYS